MASRVPFASSIDAPVNASAGFPLPVRVRLTRAAPDVCSELHANAMALRTASFADLLTDDVIRPVAVRYVAGTYWLCLALPDGQEMAAEPLSDEEAWLLLGVRTATRH